MIDICYFFNQVQMDNEICNDCPEFMNSCCPIIDSIDGYSSASECSIYLCSGCHISSCLYKSFVNQ